MCRRCLKCEAETMTDVNKSFWKPESLYFCLQAVDISWNCFSLFTPVLSFPKEKYDVNENPIRFRVSMRICLLSCFMLKRYHGRLNVDESLNFQGAICASVSSCHFRRGKNIFSPFFKCDKGLDYILTSRVTPRVRYAAEYLKTCYIYLQANTID